MHLYAQDKEDTRLFRAYVWPFVLFIACTMLLQVLEYAMKWDHPTAPWWQRAPEMWIYPLQVVLCGAYLWWRRRDIEWDWATKPCLLGALAGIVGIGFWLVPYFAGWIDASEGFDPGRIFGVGSSAYYTEYALRFARACIIVPMVEEFCWRGFLMRYAVDDAAPQKVPLGTHSWKAYLFSTLGFMIIHAPHDYAGAIIFGSIAYALTVYTRRLMPVVVMHAVANLIMAICALTCALPGLL